MSPTTHPPTRNSPNHSARANAVRFLVIHSTAGSYASALGWLCNPRSQVSAHYLLAKDGCITQLVDESRTAWHAGASAWGGVTNLNETSIGIELENANTGSDPYPAAQVDSLITLSRAIVERHRIQRADFVRHRDISPGRKTDPAGLDWFAVVQAVYTDGLPHPPSLPRYRARSLAWIREQPTTRAAKVGEVQRGEGVVVRQIIDGTTVNAGGTISNLWAETPAGYIWLPQLEALP